MIDVTVMTDEELELVAEDARVELERRKVLAEIPEKMNELATSYHRARGTADGDDWVQPTGAMDAYPAGWRVEHNGKAWISTVPGNVWAPGVSGWRALAGEGEAPAAWSQPTGAHDAYLPGEEVTHDGEVWINAIGANVWEPGVNGWDLISAAPEDQPVPDPGTGPTPNPVPVPTPAPAWKQPTGAHDSYALGSTVSHKGKTWTSGYAANSWEPGVFGWVVA